MPAAIYLPLHVEDPPSPAGDLLADMLAPWWNADLALFIRALGVMIDPYYQLVTEQGLDGEADPDYVPGWGTLLDPDLCPAEDLQYLAQYVGASIPRGADEATARSYVKAESGQARGTLASVLAAIDRNLTRTRAVTLLERTAADGITEDAYWFVVIVRPDEIVDLEQLKGDINSVKPGGVLYTIVQADGFTWEEATGAWDDEAMTWDQTANTQP